MTAHSTGAFPADCAHRHTPTHGDGLSRTRRQPKRQYKRADKYISSRCPKRRRRANVTDGETLGSPPPDAMSHPIFSSRALRARRERETGTHTSQFQFVPPSTLYTMYCAAQHKGAHGRPRLPTGARKHAARVCRRTKARSTCMSRRSARCAPPNPPIPSTRPRQRSR